MCLGIYKHACMYSYVYRVVFGADSNYQRQERVWRTVPSAYDLWAKNKAAISCACACVNLIKEMYMYMYVCVIIYANICQKISEPNCSK